MKKAVIAIASSFALCLAITTMDVPLGPRALFGPLAPALASPARAEAAGPAAAVPNAKQLLEIRGATGAVGFGQALAVSGSTLVVGAPYSSWGGRADVGLVYVYNQSGAGWQLVAELRGPEAIAHEGLGESIAVSGSTVVVGAPGYDSSAGHAYVFTKSGTGWHQAGELQGSDTVAHDRFGGSVAVSGNTIVVGAGSRADGGRAYLFTSTGGRWHQTAELTGSDTARYDGFGDAVTVSGATVVVGALFHAGLSGAIYVFSDGARGWHQAAELKGILARSYFGKSVAISGSIIVAGATGSSAGAGWAYVFTATASGWHRTATLENTDAAPRDYFGQSVAISGSTIVVGASLQAEGGRAYTFTRTAAGGWHQATEMGASDGVAYDWFGDALAISGADVVVGAPYYSGTGRAYVFEM